MQPFPAPRALPKGRRAAVDPSGRYVVGNDSRPSEVSTPDQKVAGVGDSQPIRWTDGLPQALPKLGDWVSATAVNADGVVAAIAGRRDERADSVLHYTAAGVPKKLHPPAGTWTFRSAEINAKGDIIANATSPDGTADVLLWKAGSSTATKLPPPAGAVARSLTDNGTIVGTVIVGPKDSDTSSYTWNQQGKGKQLTDPDGQHSSVYAARGDWATGNLWPSGAVGRWNLDTGDVTELPVDAPANGINAEGWIASRHGPARRRQRRTGARGRREG